MNRYFKGLYSRVAEGFGDMVRRFPIELLLSIVGCVGCTVAYATHNDQMMTYMAVVLLAGIVAIVVNSATVGRAMRALYWLCWLPFVPMLFWSGLEQWLNTSEFAVTIGVLSWLALLSSRLERNNDLFVNDALGRFRAFVFAALLPNVALGLFSLIILTIAYIFGLEGAGWVNRTLTYALIVTQTIFVPTIFLWQSQRETHWSGTRLLDVLLNYVVTPALIIYTVILYVYIIKIVALWSLPRGGVAYYVFGFTLLALLVKALQGLLTRRIYDRFFDRFSLLALPFQLLFWVGVVRRIGEYGLTEARIFLLVCGAIMTICVLLFLSSRTGRYLYVTLTAFVLFGAMVCVPQLKASRIAVANQVCRAQEVARELDVLRGDGTIGLRVPDVKDSLEVELSNRLYDALRYLRRNDSRAYAALGLDDYDDIDLLRSRAQRRDGFQEIFVAGSGMGVDLSGSYSKIYMDMRHQGPPPSYTFDCDSLSLELSVDSKLFVVTGRDLMASQRKLLTNGELHRANADGTLKRILLYNRADMTIIFSSMSLLLPADSDSVELRSLNIEAVLLR